MDQDFVSIDMEDMVDQEEYSDSDSEIDDIIQDFEIKVASPGACIRCGGNGHTDQECIASHDINN